MSEGPVALTSPEGWPNMRNKRKLKRGARKMAKPVKASELMKVQGVTIPPASEVNPGFMKVGDDIQKRHIEAFKRLADR
jgi:hypothetical protein